MNKVDESSEKDEENNKKNLSKRKSFDKNRKKWKYDTSIPIKQMTKDYHRNPDQALE